MKFMQKVDLKEYSVARNTHLFFSKSQVIVVIHFLKGFYAAWSSPHVQKLHLENQRCMGWHRICGMKQKSGQVNKKNM